MHALGSTLSLIRRVSRWGMNHGIAERQKQFKTLALSLAEGSGKGGAQARGLVCVVAWLIPCFYEFTSPVFALWTEVFLYKPFVEFSVHWFFTVSKETYV